MTSDTAFEYLLTSRNPGVVCILDRLLGNLSIGADICLSVSQALDQFSQGSIDLTVVDWDDDTADLLRGMRKSDRWHKPAVVAVSPRDYPVSGAHAVLHKPVTQESGAVSLRVAYSRRLCHYRRRTRYALMSSVPTSYDDDRSVDITITDIGDGGFGFVSKEEVLLGDVSRLRIQSPGAERPISIEARVRWTRTYGDAGCECPQIPLTDLGILDDWLKSKAQIKKPFAMMLRQRGLVGSLRPSPCSERWSRSDQNESR
jgi:hypothetical protein